MDFWKGSEQKGLQIGFISKGCVVLFLDLAIKTMMDNLGLDNFQKWLKSKDKGGNGFPG